jgi:hypothetical protein
MLKIFSISIIAFISIISPLTAAASAAPQIKNLKAEADTAEKRVIITYDLIDPDSKTVEVYLRASSDYGQTWWLYTSAATGDIGMSVRPGKEKRIIWPYKQDIGNILEFKVKLVVDDRESGNIQDIIAQSDSVRLANDVKSLEGVRHHLYGAPELEKAKELIHKRMHNDGLQSRKLSFMLGGYEGHNIEGRHLGQIHETEVIMICANFDTHENSPGADDNASGIAGMLEAARILSQYEFRRTIVFVGFDLQNQGSIGSRRYLQSRGKYNIDTYRGVYNLDMIGSYSSKSNSQDFPEEMERSFPELGQHIEQNKNRGDFVFVVGNSSSAAPRNNLYDLSQVYVPQLKMEKLSLAGNGEHESIFRHGDYQSFWEAGYPAVLITDGGASRNTGFQNKKDRASTLDYNVMNQVVRAVIASVADMAILIHGDVQETNIGLMPPKKVVQINDDKVDYQLYLVENNKVLKVRINHPKQGRLKMKLMDTAGETYYQSRIDLYYESVISIDTSYLKKGVYLVNLSSDKFNEFKEFVIPK